MARNLQVLLTENIDGTGIVGDVVNVRKGFARNFLLPRSMATTPDEKKIQELQSKRKEAIKHLGELRKAREALIARLKGQEITMIRSCNDLGILYAAVTQHEIAAELDKAGFHGIADREVRLGQPVKRVGDYPITIKFQVQSVPDDEVKKPVAAKKKEPEAALDAEIKLHVKPDRELQLGRRDDHHAPAEGAAEGGAEGEGVAKRQKDKSAKFDTAKPGAKDEEKPAKAKPEKKAEPKGEKPDKKK